MTSYIGIVHKDKKSEYGVSFPDFPGCITAGKTVEEAYVMAKEALQLHIDGMVEDGDPIPLPATFMEAKRHTFARDALLTFMVEANTPGRSKRINIMMDEHLIELIDASTKNRSAFLEAAARDRLTQLHP